MQLSSTDSSFSRGALERFGFRLARFVRQALQHSHAKIPPTPIEAARRVPNAAHIGSLREEASTKKTPPTPDVNACPTHTQFNRTCLHTVHKLSRPSHPNLLQAWRTIEVLKAQVLLRLQEWLLKPGCILGRALPKFDQQLVWKAQAEHSFH